MKPFTIFYTDDDQDDLGYFETVINALDPSISVFTHDRGEKLLHALENPPPTPHVLFLDLNMPGVTGFDVLGELKGSERHKNLPVIIFSTSTDDDIIEKTRQLGASFYLPKSNNYTALKNSIADILKIDWANFIPTKENFRYRNN